MPINGKRSSGREPKKLKMIANSDANAAFNATFPSYRDMPIYPGARLVGFGRSDDSKNAEQYDLGEPGDA
jgi:hypothetical protein